MRTGLTKRKKTTAVWFDEKNVYLYPPHNIVFKKQLLLFCRQLPIYSLWPRSSMTRGRNGAGTEADFSPRVVARSKRRRQSGIYSEFLLGKLALQSVSQLSSKIWNSVTSSGCCLATLCFSWTSVSRSYRHWLLSS